MNLFSRIKDIAAATFSRRDSYPFAMLFGKFQSILDKNNQALELIAGMGDKLGGDYVFDRQYIVSAIQQLSDLVYKLIHDLNVLAPKKYFDLFTVFEGISAQIQLELDGKWLPPDVGYVLSYEVLNQDFSEEVGNKNAKLAEVRNILELPTPDGFAITTRAFQSFMEWNRLQGPALDLLQSWEQQQDTATEQVAQSIQGQILQGSIPPDVSHQVLQALHQLRHRSQAKDFCLAVRSSARAEDGAHSFAGQYKSFLNVAEKDLFDAYKKILASAYSGSALEYRRQGGFLSHEIAMAVGCQVMVDAKASGVLYTMDPASPQREVMMISATWGLGAPVVEGQVQADQYVLERTPPYAVKALRIVPKVRLLLPAKGGGTEWGMAAEELQGQSCLKPEQLRTLAEMALQIERYFKRPQDIEWALDQNGQFVILQARPLNIRAQNQEVVCDISKMAEQYPVLLQGRGAVVQRGIGAGKVFVVKSEEDLLHFPHGAILVAPQTSPRLARVIRKAQGILTDVGSPTGHMATVAREFRVPTVVNTGIATQVLHQDMEITMDAAELVVYAGIVKELCYYEFTEVAVFEESYEYRLLNRLLKRITPLKLLDPHDKTFTSAGCKTFHDIIRFIHEKAVEELIHIGYSRHRDMDKKARQLKFAIPLGLIVIDIGGGTEVAGTPSELTPEHITSIPMRAFLQGLMEPGMWSTEPVSVDFGSFMSSLTRTFSSSLATPQYVGQNLAVVSREYFDLSLRLGYHFNIIDAYITENLNDNYAYFRFLGGVTDPVRRSRRAKFIGEILERFNFRVEIRGDLVVGRIKKLGRPQMEEKMWLIGCLVGYTRQLDIRMNSEEHLDQCVDDFMQRTAKQQGQTGSSEEVP